MNEWMNKWMHDGRNDWMSNNGGIENFFEVQGHGC